MNLDTVRKCAEVVAELQKNALGVVSADVQDLLDELNAEPEAAPEAAPVPAKKAAKKTAA